jgi:hypothetical protein
LCTKAQKNFGDLPSYLTYRSKKPSHASVPLNLSVILDLRDSSAVSYHFILQVYRWRSRNGWRYSQEVGQAEHCGRFEKCARHAAYNKGEWRRRRCEAAAVTQLQPGAGHSRQSQSCLFQAGEVSQGSKKQQKIIE